MYPGVFTSLLVGMRWRDGVINQKLALLAQDKGVYAADFGVWWEFSGVRARQFWERPTERPRQDAGQWQHRRETMVTGTCGPRAVSGGEDMLGGG